MRTIALPIKRVLRNIVIIGIVAVILRSCFHMFFGEQGRVNHISELKRVYDRVGGPIRAHFPDSLLQQFPFDGPVDYKLIVFKEPLVLLMGKINTNGLHHYVTNHPSTEFIWSGTDSDGGSWLEVGSPTTEEFPGVRWTNMMFKATSGEGIYNSSCLDCTADFSTGKVLLRSY